MWDAFLMFLATLCCLVLGGISHADGEKLGPGGFLFAAMLTSFLALKSACETVGVKDK